MIGEPVALTIRRSIERPSAAVMRAFEGAPTGFVTDAYNGKGCMDHSIKPLTPEMYVCGTAITAQCSGGDDKGEIDCFQACYIAELKKGTDPNDAKGTCGGQCATPSCGTIAGATSELVACLDKDCLDECFPTK